jgi:hypothetical protein
MRPRDTIHPWRWVLHVPAKIRGHDRGAPQSGVRAGKLEIGAFGPLGYVLAHQVADAQAVAAFADANGQTAAYTASITTWPAPASPA